MGDIAALVKRLKDIPWTWSAAGMECALASLDSKPIDRVPGRSTYAIAAGPQLSVYDDCGRPELLEITMDAFLDSHWLSAEEYERKVDEYFEKYEEAVAAPSGHHASTMAEGVRGFQRTKKRCGWRNGTSTMRAS